MRHLTLIIAVVTTMGFSQVARTLPLTAYGDDTLDVYVSGASAQDNALENLFRLQCESGTLDIYRVGGNQRVFFCRIGGRDRLTGAIDAFPARQKVALFKTSVGGSGNGVGPLIRSRPLRFIDMAVLKQDAASRCPAERRRTIAAAPPFDAFQEHVCTSSKAAARVPDAGLSDVEPRMFAERYGFSDQDIATLTVRSANAVIFGIPVTLKLRDALQAAQFTTDSACHPEHPQYDTAGEDGVVPAESEACMPGLTRPQLAGIFAGTLHEWDLVVNRDGYAMAAVDPATGRITTPPTVMAPADTRVHVCRRVDTSGTQASYEMFFLNQRCTTNAVGFAGAGATVALGTGTSNVKTCLEDRNAKNLWAVGIFSTENVEDTVGGGWRFIKMDRTAPTLLNTFNGRWSFFVEQTIQWRNSRSENPLRGARLKLIEHLSRQAGNPIVLRALNERFRHSWGNGGVLALNTNGHRPPLPVGGVPVSDASIDANPVLALSRAASGEPNNCNPPLAIFPTVAP